jgi:hypothetical protein
MYWLFERLSGLGCDRGDKVQRWGKQLLGMRDIQRETWTKSGIFVHGMDLR